MSETNETKRKPVNTIKLREFASLRGADALTTGYLNAAAAEIDRLRTALDAKEVPPPAVPPAERLAELRKKEDAIEEERRAIYRASLDAPASEKVCDDSIAEMLGREETFLGEMKFPYVMTGITYGDRPVVGDGMRPTGSWVAVKPCAPECKGKTYLGVLLGDIATSAGAVFHTKTGVLEIHVGHRNPAMWVPELKRIVFGRESWWTVLKKPEDLRQITDADIQGVWYVQALRALSGQPAQQATVAAPSSDDTVNERARQVAALRAIAMNDKTTYEHHEVRPRDGASPNENKGTIWLTPRELALNMLKTMGEETESLYWPFRGREPAMESTALP